MNSFNELSLPTPLMKSLEIMKFLTPTPIQAKAIPLAQKNLDLIACAQTGTGKTAAFLIPIFQRIIETKNTRALIVVPTRELANQIEEVAYQLARHSRHIQTTVIIGGASMGRQMRALEKRPQIIIGTPGRLIDHMERGSLDLQGFQMAILDEADRMFDMGFSEPMNRILSAIPTSRQTLLFSATVSKEVVTLAQKYMNTPEQIRIGSVDQPVNRIRQVKIEVEGRLKNEKLLSELQTRSGRILVFMRTKIRVDRLTRFLRTHDVKVSSIHGGRTQAQREAALESFRQNEASVLVATDVASRGLDIPAIQTVFNFDLPETREDYIHRIGRTARAGTEGEAVSFVTPEETQAWRYLEKATADKEKTHGAPNSQRKSKVGGHKQAKRSPFHAFKKMFGMRRRMDRKKMARNQNPARARTHA